MVAAERSEAALWITAESDKYAMTETDEMVVPADLSCANIEIRLADGGVIRGAVRDASGFPFHGTIELAEAVPGLQRTWTTRTNDMGEFVFLGLPLDREYELEANVHFELHGRQWSDFFSLGRVKADPNTRFFTVTPPK